MSERTYRVALASQGSNPDWMEVQATDWQDAGRQFAERDYSENPETCWEWAETGFDLRVQRADDGVQWIGRFRAYESVSFDLVGQTAEVEHG